MSMNFKIEKNRIVMYGENETVLAEVTFPSYDSETVIIDHTFVDDSLRGQGIAGKLLQEAAKYLEKENKKVIPTCSYASSWFTKNPEYQKLLSTNSIAEKDK